MLKDEKTGNEAKTFADLQELLSKVFAFLSIIHEIRIVRSAAWLGEQAQWLVEQAVR